MTLRIPTKGNPKLDKLMEHIDADLELQQLWRSANVNAVTRFGISDHGEVHIRIVTNAALRIIRLLIEGGVVPSVVKDHEMQNEDAEVVVVLAACLHDVGISIHRDDHERYSLIISYTKARQLLTETGLSVAAVAQSVGYDDPLYFSRLYRRKTGRAPSEERG